jgi:shikimate kinase
MNYRLKSTPGLYVVGFMGSGKTTVGRHLALRLGWNFFDIDEEIEAAEHTTIARIFESRGEPEFRRIETAVLTQHVHWIEHGRPAVLALGGGAFVGPANRQLIEDHGLSIWLDCPFEVVQKRVAAAHHRPLARDPQKFAALFAERREIYRLADIQIPFDSDDPNVAVDAIVHHPLLK